MKNISVKKYFLSFIFVDIFVAVFSLLQGKKFFISSQVGFISSVLVILSSYYSYKKMVQNKIEQGDIPHEIEDDLDKIDDKYELYQENEDIKKIVELEKSNIKGIKNSAKNVKKSFSAIISPYRLGAYLFLILSFLYLHSHNLLHIWGYLLGISIVSIVTLILSLIL